MRKLLIVLMLALALPVGGCARLMDAINYATSARVSPVGVYIAANTFDGLEATAINYLGQPSCAKNPPPCRRPQDTQPIKEWLGKGQKARDNLEAFLDSHPGQLGLQGDYDALNAAIEELQRFFPQKAVAK